MADATPVKGYNALITLGATNKVLGCSKFTISGSTRKTQDVSEFGNDTDRFATLSLDPGTVSLSDVIFDKDDPYQAQITTALADDTSFGPGDLRLWVSANAYWTVGVGGTMIVTNGGKLDISRGDVGKTGFEFKVSGAPMVLVSGALDAPTITITTTTQTVATATIAMIGTATVDPDAEIVSITWVNDDLTSGVATGTTAWTATVSLSTGVNTITFTVLDSNGVTATDSVDITRS